ncbi:MAG: UDP-N-acetylmuramoylalanyl-D-glutamate--2,6-diaminopimelate ligase [Nocardioidaceae bacterium]|nr:UDP-N-acetylmuramoylalanyl-D-glutamate--2,6-diaminopimelate ligase [Nocardioidaceae bacterium]
MTTAAALDPRPSQVARTRLADLLDSSGLTGSAALSPQDGAVEVTGMTLDSRAVRPGDLYAALPGGRTHGARFCPAAVQAGAAAVLTDAAGRDLIGEGARALAHDVPVVVAEQPRRLLGLLAAAVYGCPAESMLVVGVTGTQGKTTVTYLLEAALRGAGRVPGVMGTTGTRVAGQPVASRLTTPEAPDLHALLAVMRERSVDACAMEVSSHALVQGRVDGVVFDVAVFLNLGRDHLDFHRDVEDYFAAKARLFTPERARRAVVDVGDGWGRRLAETTTLPVTTCTVMPDADADWTVADVTSGQRGSEFTVRGPAGRTVRLRLPLPGVFNVRNALAALVALAEAGVDLEPAARGLEAAPGVPGRMERVDAGQDFLALVDYAHKPDAVEAVLSALRPATPGRLIVVLGAGGERDAGKRPLMGAVAGRLADLLVVTDDNPRGEDPAAIRAEVLDGVRGSSTADPAEGGAGGGAEVVEIGDRAAAIAAAVAAAGSGDTVVVAGKGHETGQEISGKVHPFDDRDVLRAALAARSAGRA